MAELASIGSYDKGTGAQPSARPFWRFGYHTRISLWGFAFVLPTLIFFAVFKYGPMLWAIGLSFNSYDMVSAPQFVGFDNYRALLGDPIFRETLANTLLYIGGSTLLVTVSGLGLALAINTGIPGARHCMTAMFLTNLMPIIAVCLVWRLLLHPYGVVNQILQPFGFGRIDWLTNASTAMPAIIMVTVWRFAPYFMVVFLAALLALSEDYYEAAELDGAGPIRRFFYITLPLLMPTIFFVVVVSALLSARIFLMPYLITGGGPGNATRVLSMLIYETGFSYLKMGQAAAISVVLFAIMLVFTTLQMRLFSRSERIYL
jgi:multiple sugar transport system permease protein